MKKSIGIFFFVWYMFLPIRAGWLGDLYLTLDSYEQAFIDDPWSFFWKIDKFIPESIPNKNGEIFTEVHLDSFFIPIAMMDVYSEDLISPRMVTYKTLLLELNITTNENNFSKQIECEIIPAHMSGNYRYLEIRPLRSHRKFLLYPSIIKIKDITIKFYNIDSTIKLFQSVFYNSSLVLDELPYPGPYLYIVTSRKHHIKTGDFFHSQGSHTGDKGIDNYINRDLGHTMGKDPWSPPRPNPGDIIHFNPPLSIYGYPYPPLPQILTIRVTKYRFRVPIRFRTLYQ